LVALTNYALPDGAGNPFRTDYRDPTVVRQRITLLSSPLDARHLASALNATEPTRGRH
jgi:hypothetical protein